MLLFFLLALWAPPTLRSFTVICLQWDKSDTLLQSEDEFMWSILLHPSINPPPCWGYYRTNLPSPFILWAGVTIGQMIPSSFTSFLETSYNAPAFIDYVCNLSIHNMQFYGPEREYLNSCCLRLINIMWNWCVLPLGLLSVKGEMRQMEAHIFAFLRMKHKSTH